MTEPKDMSRQMLLDCFDAIEHLYGKHALADVGAYMKKINRARESNAQIDEIESALAAGDA